MEIHYLPVFFLFFFALLMAGMLLAMSIFVGPKKPNPVKDEPFECGMDPIGEPRVRFSIKFYLIAMMFLLFDIEAVFLYPWAVLFRKLGLFGFIEMMVFLLILVFGFVYIWRKGALEWE